MASLVADYSSNSETDHEESDSDYIDTSAVTPAGKLPQPELSGMATLKNSVFSNPFIEAEKAKKAILEKHVKMTPTQEHVKSINGKKICWNFRKGRCRFGHTCKFAHDSDLHQGGEEGDATSVPPAGDEDGAAPDEATDQSVRKKKKRPGLSQTLVPGKKVMKMKSSHTRTESVREVCSSSAGPVWFAERYLHFHGERVKKKPFINPDPDSNTDLLVIDSVTLSFWTTRLLEMNLFPTLLPNKYFNATMTMNRAINEKRNWPVLKRLHRKRPTPLPVSRTRRVNLPTVAKTLVQGHILSDDCRIGDWREVIH
uniref:C3H1-type domain-containing protein n=1 Tax=Timema douglasi TaxID=61478 RepID=A0A7R8VUA6_TIMDO|nr:unnamed protein product [Timema douglasi]